jgi:hypothetical protein
MIDHAAEARRGIFLSTDKATRSEIWPMGHWCFDGESEVWVQDLRQAAGILKYVVEADELESIDYANLWT